MRFACSFVTALTVAAPAVASAGPDHFVTIDRMDDSSRAGVDVAVQVDTPDATFLRLDAHGQYVDPASGLGGYLTAPIGHAAGGGESYTSLGDVEAGVLYSPRLSNPDLKVVLHGGLTLPTAPSDNDHLLTNVYTVGPRLTDFYLVVPEGWSLRLGVSPIVRSGALFARADVGLDVNLHAAQGENVDSVVRVDAGAGIDLGDAALMAELTNIHVNGDGGDWLDTGALTLRGEVGTVQPYAAFVVGLDDDARDLIHEAITVGIDGRLR